MFLQLPEKTFDAVKFMRQERDKLSEKLSKMTKEEIIEYFNKRKSQTTIKPQHKNMGFMSSKLSYKHNALCYEIGINLK
jgi:hypothetical protein